MSSRSTLFGANAPFIEELYEHYLASPESVPPEWREYFDELRDGAQDVAHAPVVESFRELARSRKVAHAMVDAGTMHKQVLVLQMIGKFRVLGLYHADLDPLKRMPPPYIPDLDLKTYGFSEADLDTEFDAGSFKAGGQRMKLRDIIDALHDTYCRTFGAEYMDIADTATKRWVQGKIEPIRARPSYDAARKRDILERLTAAETLERYLHTKYVGQKRFSLEGGGDDDPDARPPDPARRRVRRERDRDRHGASRPPERAGQHAGQDAERPVLGVRRQACRRTCRRATSNTTRASRRTSSRPAGRCT